MTDYRRFLYAGIAGPAITIILTLLDTAISPWFTWTGNALSDLGVHQYSYLFNYSLIFEGIMNFILAIALFRLLRLPRLTAALLAVGGVSLGMVGIFVETYHLYHLTFALIYFILFPVSIMMISSRISREHIFQARLGTIIASASLLDIIIGIVVGFSVIPGVSLGLAIPEMIEAVLLGAWSIYISAWLIGSPQPAVSSVVRSD